MTRRGRKRRLVLEDESLATGRPPLDSVLVVIGPGE